MPLLLVYCFARHAHRLRLRAIGHLHEVEDESQEFGDLRAARNAYQTDGNILVWEALAQLADHERNVQESVSDVPSATLSLSRSWLQPRGRPGGSGRRSGAARRVND